MSDERFAGELELAEEPVQRRVLDLWQGKIGHGMKASLEQMALPKIIRIKAARQAVLLDNQRLQAKTGSADAGGQAGQSAANDDKLVISHDKNRE